MLTSSRRNACLVKVQLLSGAYIMESQNRVSDDGSSVYRYVGLNYVLAFHIDLERRS
jgi:hypothetical protein